MKQAKNTGAYSSTPLAKKLGIKSGYNVRLINAPEYYLSLLTDLPSNVCFTNDTNTAKDLIHYFAETEEDLNSNLPQLKKEIKTDGAIWVSWPKKAAKMKSGINENTVRMAGLKSGLVDIKVCAVDETWSALKLVIPVKNRGQQNQRKISNLKSVAPAGRTERNKKTHEGTL